MLTEDSVPQPRTRSTRNYAQLPRFQRVKVSVLGRYMLADRREFPCQVLEMSPGDALVVAPVAGGVGERVVAYLDHLGRIEGAITSLIDGGFHTEVIASARKRDKMVGKHARRCGGSHAVSAGCRVCWRPVLAGPDKYYALAGPPDKSRGAVCPDKNPDSYSVRQITV